MALTSEFPGTTEDGPPPSAARRRTSPGGTAWREAREPAAGSRPARAAPKAATLGIPDYDELSASQVVERLDGLQAGELDAVRAYEEAHRSRRTILYKIEQLTS